jgi:hypothetical protein
MSTEEKKTKPRLAKSPEALERAKETNERVKARNRVMYSTEKNKGSYAASKVLCPCGSMVSTRNPYHEGSKKHLAWKEAQLEAERDEQHDDAVRQGIAPPWPLSWHACVERGVHRYNTAGMPEGTCGDCLCQKEKDDAGLVYHYEKMRWLTPDEVPLADRGDTVWHKRLRTVAS